MRTSSPVLLILLFSSFCYAEDPTYGSDCPQLFGNTSRPDCRP